MWPVWPRHGQGAAPTETPGSQGCPEPAGVLGRSNYSLVACEEGLFRGGKLSWVLYLPINTSNS